MPEQTSTIINGSPLPYIPWEDRPAGSSAAVWRSARNPIIPHDLIPSSNSIFNSAVVPYQGGFAGVFRCDNKARTMQLHAGRSDDGVTWTIGHQRIRFVPDNDQVAEINEFQYAYDPRVVWIEDRYYVTWCNGYHGPTIGVGYTYDFTTFYHLGTAQGARFNRRRKYAQMFPKGAGNHAGVAQRCVQLMRHPSDQLA